MALLDMHITQLNSKLMFETACCRPLNFSYVNFASLQGDEALDLPTTSVQDVGGDIVRSDFLTVDPNPLDVSFFRFFRLVTASVKKLTLSESKNSKMLHEYI